MLDGRTNDVRLAVNTTLREYASLREPLEAHFDVIKTGFDKAALVFENNLQAGGRKRPASR